MDRKSYDIKIKIKDDAKINGIDNDELINFINNNVKITATKSKTPEELIDEFFKEEKNLKYKEFLKSIPNDIVKPKIKKVVLIDEDYKYAYMIDREFLKSSKYNDYGVDIIKKIIDNLMHRIGKYDFFYYDNYYQINTKFRYPDIFEELYNLYNHLRLYNLNMVLVDDKIKLISNDDIIIYKEGDVFDKYISRMKEFNYKKSKKKKKWWEILKRKDR